MDDRALRLLTDADWSVLDASDCVRLTEEGLLTALRLAPNLRWLDVTGCNASAAVLRALPSLCPGITVLRLGEQIALCSLSSSAVCYAKLPACRAKRSCRATCWRVRWHSAH